MKTLKILSLTAFALGSFFLTSCGCCTGEEPVPPLRPVPVMQDLPGAAEIPVLDDLHSCSFFKSLPPQPECRLFYDDPDRSLGRDQKNALPDEEVRFEL